MILRQLAVGTFASVALGGLTGVAAARLATCHGGEMFCGLAEFAAGASAGLTVGAVVPVHGIGDYLGGNGSLWATAEAASPGWPARSC